MSTVRIERGAVRGAEHDGVHSFLGIPYAAAPLGPLRWAAPAPMPAWDGVREATAFGNSSMQTVRGDVGPVTPESEDCLNPQHVDDRAGTRGVVPSTQTGVPREVMVTVALVRPADHRVPPLGPRIPPKGSIVFLTVEGDRMAPVRGVKS